MGRIRPNERIPHRPTACGATNGSIGQRDSPDGGVSGWSIAEKSYAIAGLIRINFRVRPFICQHKGGGITIRKQRQSHAIVRGERCACVVLQVVAASVVADIHVAVRARKGDVEPPQKVHQGGSDVAIVVDLIRGADGNGAIGLPARVDGRDVEIIGAVGANPGQIERIADHR